MNSRFMLGIAALLAATAAHAQLAPKRATAGDEPVRSVIWVGNSFYYFNNGIHRFMNGFSGPAASDARVRSVLVGIGGSGLDWHDVDSYLRPGSRMGSYSFVNDTDLRFNKEGRQFDAAIMMDCSQCPIHPQLKSVFHEYAKKHSETARKYGVRPVFFMSWAYKEEPAMTQQLADAYTEAGNANDALVIPAGLAFAKAMSKRPALELYYTDKKHPSNAGSYLAAATSFAALTGRSPVGSSYRGGLDADTARFLQEVAWETVQEYYAPARKVASSQ